MNGTCQPYFAHSGVLNLKRDPSLKYELTSSLNSQCLDSCLCYFYKEKDTS